MSKRKSNGARAAPTPRLTAKEKRWRAQDDLRTLQSAHEIKKDKGRCDAACREAQMQIQALAQVKPRRS